MFHSDVFFDAAYRTHDWNVDLLQSFADHHFKLSLIMMSVKVGQVCMYHVSKDATVRHHAYLQGFSYYSSFYDKCWLFFGIYRSVLSLVCRHDGPANV